MRLQHPRPNKRGLYVYALSVHMDAEMWQLIEAIAESYSTTKAEAARILIEAGSDAFKK